MTPGTINPRLKDLTGRRFSRLLVIEMAGRNEHRLITWLCRCDCGNAAVVVGERLNSGMTKSCGCLMHNGDARRTHGKRHTSEYESWAGAKARCTNPNNAAYERYGGRGITMCDRWLNDFAAFLADMGQKPSPAHSLDRFPDNNGNYEPGNCRWATAKEQAANRRPPRWNRWTKPKDLSDIRIRRSVVDAFGDGTERRAGGKL